MESQPATRPAEIAAVIERAWCNFINISLQIGDGIVKQLNLLKGPRMTPRIPKPRDPDIEGLLVELGAWVAHTREWEAAFRLKISDKFGQNWCEIMHLIAKIQNSEY